jgi:hypothetical protein
MPISDVSSGAGVGEVGVDARINTRVGESNSCTYDSIFEGFGFVVPLATPICNAPLHCQDAVVFVH